MTGYEAEYGTDWETLEAEEALERAYALGIAETFGEAVPGELDRIRDAVGTAHDRALVQLAYDKGRSRGRTVRPEADSDSAAWSTLLDASEREPVPIADERDLPPALRGLPLLDPPADGLDRIRLPRFLTRR